MRSSEPDSEKKSGGGGPAPAFSVIVAANNEEHYIGACLSALLAQTAEAGPLEIIVAANGCTDRTEAIVREFEPKVAGRGWRLVLLSIPDSGKLLALNRADAVAGPGPRAYLDADVLCDPDLFGQLRDTLARDTAVYATGTLQVMRAKSWVTRCYADFWTRLPFVQGGAVGAGLFAVNPAGRARWGQFPQIISDDTFVRLQFAPTERVEVPAAYHWPMVEGFRNLVRVRRRQDAGGAEVYRHWPSLRGNEDKVAVTTSLLARLTLRAPVSFAIYALVAVTVRLRRSGAEWSRGR